MEAIEVSVDADEAAAIPYRPGMMTLLTVEPRLSIIDELRSLIFKPRAIHIDYGPGPWRYANGDVATRLMLNAPISHPSFPMQPLTPYEQISIDSAADLTFEFMPVMAASDASSGPVSIGKLIDQSRIDTA